MRTRLLAVSLFVFLAALTTRAQTPLGTAFTYQGRLIQAGQPFDGSANLVFKLYDASSDGNLLGTQTLDGVAVSAGLFTITLEFWEGAFDGDARWLEVMVNGTPLSPRQPITAAPYALSLAPGATVYGGANGLNTLSLYHSDAYTSAIYALHTATGGTALYGESDSGAGSKGVWGLSTEGVGVYGSSETGTAGVYGQSNSTSGRGVVGEASAATGTTYGVAGESFSPAGGGVFGLSNNDFGGTGVYGQSIAAVGGYGVRGEDSAFSGWGVFATGRLGSSGTKAFRIDHPDDPANKYLLHYSAESPEVINFYRGTVVLDGAGEAVVELPHYFAKINRMPSYQLTAVGAPMPMLHVAEEIDEVALLAGANAGPGEVAPLCSFRIAGGAPGAKVSWRVEVVRNDRWVQNRGTPVEVEKEGLEKGTYQHPELYGQPPELGMNYHVERERPSPATSPEVTRQE